MNPKSSNKNKPSLNGSWLAVGIGMGVALGVALDNIGVGISLGVVFGTFFSLNQTAKSAGTDDRSREEDDRKNL
jgi:hypothetical protein